MEFLILGPLEILNAGRVVELGGPQQRALLAVLLLNANRVVSIDQLLETVWEGSPPSTAPKALQVHISHLRKLLGHDRVVTQAPGYLLRTQADELDAARFERLWQEGRLQDALALWRGPPLTEFVYHDFARLEIARLEERRLLCIEERMDADLAAGRHEAVISELETLVREQPLREGLRSRLMIALYRSARQADALRVYQEGRDVLVGELGIEPSRALRDLQRRILAQDELLELPAPVDAHPAAPRVEAVPAGLPIETDTRKTVTALSARITVRANDDSALDPELLRDLITGALGEIEAALARHGGTIDSAAGDAVTAVFGVPVIHEDDGVRSVRAADEMRRRVAALGEAAAARSQIELRVGISTGRVVSGGGRGSHSRTTGEPLLRSARLSEGANPGDVLCDEPTWRLVRHDATCEPADGAWRLVCLGEVAAVPHRLTSPMIGRDRDRRRLHDTFDQSLGDRSCHRFTVLGLAGVGKSRLVHEFLAELGDAVAVARGRCLPYGEGITYWPLLEATKEAVGLDDSESREIAREKVLRAFGDDNRDPELADRVCRMIGLAEEAEHTVEEGFAAVRALFEALARERPLVVVFDDIHWGETTFLDLVEDVAEWSRDAPILIVCVARPELLELRPGWGGGKSNVTTSLLEPLSTDDCAQLIENLLDDAELPVEITGKIVDAAEGNPLFVEEMLQMLIEDGVVTRNEGRWAAAGDLEAIRVPPTIEALLASRLDRLSAAERAVIERAAVCGKVFYQSAIVDLSPPSLVAEIDAALRSLVRKELIRPERGTLAGQGYRFRHLLILDAAYDAISKHARADLHERFGRWLERVAGDRVTEYEEVVGYHFEQAFRLRAELGPLDEAARALAEDAAGRLGNAGRRAFGLSDATGGIKLISRAVALLPPDDPRRVELVPNVRAIQALNRDVSWADRVLTEAVEAAATSGDRLLAARALVQRGLLRLFTDEHVTAAELRDAADRSIVVFREHNDELGLARSWRLKGQAEYLARRGAGCAADSERALDHVKRAADPFEEREIVEWLAIALLLGPAPAAEALRRCERLFEEARADELLQAELLGSMSALVTMLSGPADDRAEELAARSRSIMATLGKHVWVVAYWRSFAPMAQHNAVGAENELRPAYEALKQLGEKSHFSTISHALAAALYLQGRLPEAAELTRECEEACRPNDVHSQVLWRSTRAKILARTGSLDEARQLGRAALDLAATSDFLLAHGQAASDVAELSMLAGAVEEAAAAEATAALVFGLKGVKPEVAAAWRY